jgi:hypothetical protein
MSKLKIGQKFVYTERNSIFEIVAPPNPVSKYYTVYYPATGQYRRYTETRINTDCRPYGGPPKKRTKQNIQVDLPGFMWPIIINLNTGTVSCGHYQSRPGTASILFKALKGRKK